MDQSTYDLFVYDDSPWLPLVKKDYLIKEPAGLETHKNAIVLPTRYRKETVLQYGDGLLEGGLSSEKGAFIAGLQRSYKGKHSNRDCCFSYKVSHTELERRDEEVIFGGLLTSHFGHMNGDCTSRLWYTASHPEVSTKVVFVMYPNQMFPYWDLLEMTGLPKDRIEIISKPTMFSSVIVPGETTFSNGNKGFKKEWTYVLGRIRDSVPKSPHKKIYYTRTQFANSGCVGEEYYEDFFRDNGFHVVAPEQLPFKEQVSLMAGAETFASTVGSIASQIMFANPGTHLIALSRSKEIGAAPFRIVQAVGARITVIDAHKNVLPEGQGGGSIHLMAPTPCWDSFLNSQNELKSDTASRNYDLGKNLLDYSIEWAKRYETPRLYRWIRNETVPEMIKRFNFYLRDKRIDVSKYSKTAEYTKALSKIDQLVKDLVDAKARSWDHALATVVPNQGEINLSGSLPLPFGTTMPSHVECEIVQHAGSTENILVLQTSLHLNDDNDEITWNAMFSPKPPYTSTASFSGHLTIVCGDRAKRVPLVSESTESTPSLFLPAESKDESYAFATGAYGDRTLFRFDDASALLPAELDYEIEDFRWKGNDLEIDCRIIEQECIRGNVICEPVLLASGKPFESDALKFYVPDNQHCHIKVDGKLLAQEMKRANTKLVSFKWQLRTGRHRSMAPFGKRRQEGAVARYRCTAISCDGVHCIPIDGSEKNIGFKLITNAECLSASTGASITSITRGEHGFEMAGQFKSPLLGSQLLTGRILLASEDGNTIPLETSNLYHAGKNVTTWNAVFDASEHSNTLNPSTWTVRFEKTLGQESKTEQMRIAISEASQSLESMSFVHDNLAVKPLTRENELCFSIVSQSESLFAKIQRSWSSK